MGGHRSMNEGDKAAVVEKSGLWAVCLMPSGPNLQEAGAEDVVLDATVVGFYSFLLIFFVGVGRRIQIL